jgi:predicted Zn finger-like uncharacterized protein
MAIVVSCPSCGVQLSIPEDHVGKKVRCATCSTVFEANMDAPPPAEVPRRARDWGDEDREREPDDSDAAEDHDSDWERRRRRRDLAPHRGSLILALGIGSVVTGLIGVCCCIFPVISIPLGAVSWVLGSGDLRRIDNGDMDPDGRSTTQAGYICGIIGCGLGVLGLICIALGMIFNISTMMMPGQRRF